MSESGSVIPPRGVAKFLNVVLTGLSACLSATNTPPVTDDAGWNPLAETAWEHVIALQTEGRNRSAFLAANALLADFPGTTQANLAQGKRAELLNLLWMEAGNTLNGLFAAEHSFFQERDFYTTNLSCVAFTPVARPAYTYGFLAPCQPQKPYPNCTALCADCSLTNDPTMEQNFDPSEMVNFDGAALEAILAAKGIPATMNCNQCPQCSYVAIAVSSLDPDGGLDVWAVHSNGAIDHVVDDLYPDGGP